jgi:hypothetical protein
MLTLGMSCPITRNQQTIKAGNLGWDIRQDDDTGISTVVLRIGHDSSTWPMLFNSLGQAA